MKRIALLVVLSTVVAGISFFAGRAHKLKGQATVRKPFTATIVEQRYSQGTVSADWPGTEMIMYSVRSDGSTAEIMRRQDPNKNWVNMKVITDAGSAKRMSLDPTTRSITTYSLPQSSFSLAEPSTCRTGTGAQHSTILGYDVVKVEEKANSMPGDTSSYESWRAPALDCFPMYESASPTADLNGPTRTTRQVVFLIEGEPASSLFSIPADYTERSPSAAMKEFQRLFPTETQCESCATSMSILDNAYAATHSH
jgi:hypothetical protein